MKAFINGVALILALCVFLWGSLAIAEAIVLEDLKGQLIITEDILIVGNSLRVDAQERDAFIKSYKSYIGKMPNYYFVITFKTKGTPYKKKFYYLEFQDAEREREKLINILQARNIMD